MVLVFSLLGIGFLLISTTIVVVLMVRAPLIDECSCSKNHCHLEQLPEEKSQTALPRQFDKKSSIVPKTVSWGVRYSEHSLDTSNLTTPSDSV